MRLFKLIVTLFTSIAITSAASAADIKMAKANWDTGYSKLKFTNKLWKKWDTQ